MASLDGWSNKSLSKGSSQPPYVDGKVRVYSMRFCPYAQRALLALCAKNVPFEVVNIDTRNKPEWFVEKLNPIGGVPTIQYKDQVVYESLIAAEYLDDSFEGTKKLLPKDPFLKAKQKLLLEKFIKIGMGEYKLYMDKNDAAAAKDVQDVLELFEQTLKSGDYFSGNEPGWVDYMIWPWVERMSAVAIQTDGKVAICKDKHPKLTAYVERMQTRPEIKVLLRTGQEHLTFFNGYLKGAPDFDFML